MRDSIKIPLFRCDFTITVKLPTVSRNQNRSTHTVKGHIFPLTLIQREEGKLSSCSQLVSNKQNLKIKNNLILIYLCSKYTKFLDDLIKQG